MSKGTSANSIALVGPDRPPVGPLAERLSRSRIERFTLEDYVRSRRAPDRVVLCPKGESLEEDLAFLREAGARLLWPAPRREIAAAIGGLLTAIPSPPGDRPACPRNEQLHPALLLEGDVTEERAKAALDSPLRRWVVESARRVRLGAATFSRLRRAGVRWAALRPIEVLGLLASPALARARPRWRRWLPADVPVWVVA